MATAAVDFGPMDTEPVQDTGIDTSLDTQGAEPEVQPEAPEGQSQTGETLDGRRGPANIRNSIKAATEALPEQAAAFKELGNAYFREQAFKQHFATPQEAASAKQLIESIGGVDGITQMQQQAQRFQAQDDFLREGNPEVLADFAKDFPEGFAALAPHYLEKLAQVNPEAFSAAVVPYAIGLLENAGMGNFIKAIAAETDPSRQKQMLAQLDQWYASAKQGATRQPAARNPGEERLKQQQTELEQQRQQMFTEGVQSKVNATVNPELDRFTEQTAKAYNLNDAQKQAFRARLAARIIQQMNGDQTYKKQVDLRKNAKGATHESVGSYIASEFNRRLKDAAFQEANETWGAPKRGVAQPTGVVKAGSPKTAPNGGPLFVSARPADAMMDLTRTSDLDVIKGRAYLKDGRYVTWRRG
jgi:hypothetical protein